MNLIDKDALVAELERLVSNGKLKCQQSQENNDQESYIVWSEHIATLGKILSFINTLEVKEVIAEQECTCNEALNRIIGGSWNILCPVNKLGLKTGDKVKVIIKAQEVE